MVLHARRAFVLLLNQVIQRPAFLQGIGYLNRSLGFLSNVFIMYPATQSIALRYVYPRHLAASAWSPQLGAVFFQNRRLGLAFFVSSTEPMFEASNGIEGLRVLQSNAEKLKTTLGARHLTYAGILPMLLARHGLRRAAPETEIAVRAVVDAEERLREAHSLPPDTPIILLGGKGYVGTQVAKAFAGRSLFTVDQHSSGLPHHLKGASTVLINLSRIGVLDAHIDSLWHGVVILNEVYPPPRRATQEALESAGIPLWHIVGLRGKSFPSFPAAYGPGIPCCAGRLHREMKILLRKL